jgi:hypothetical protein
MRKYAMREALAPDTRETFTQAVLAYADAREIRGNRLLGRIRAALAAHPLSADWLNPRCERGDLNPHESYPTGT